MQRLDRARQGLAIGLAALAGFVDATGFLSAGGYFVSFMSGNTTRLAVDLAEEPRRAIVPAALILGFVSGVTGGSLAAMAAGARRKVAVLALTALLLTLSALAHTAGIPGLALAGLVVAMGALNNTFQRDGEVSVGLTYMTGALVRLGQGLAASLTGRPRAGWAAYLRLWLGLATGAVLGALAFHPLGGPARWLAALWAGLLALAAARFNGGGEVSGEVNGS